MRGSLTRRGKSSWRIKFDIGRDPQTGKRRFALKTVCGTKRDAERELSRMLHHLATGEHVEPSRVTVSSYLSSWLKEHQTRVSPKTFERHAEIVAKHLALALGAHPLQRLSAMQVQEYYAKALLTGRRDGRGGLSAQTVVHHHRVLHAALAKAVRLRLIARNVAVDVDPPKPRRKEIKILDECQVAELLSAAQGSTWHGPILVAATTGLRRGEVLGLRWSDVDFERNRLHVAQVLSETMDGLSFKEPKTSRGRRTVTLPSIAIEALKRRKASQAEVRLALGLGRDETALVFSREDGGPLPPSNFTQAFTHIAARAGINGVSLHSLRHSHASQLLKAGVNPKVASERLGHSSVSITLDIYSQVVPSLQEDVANTVDLALRTALERNATKT